MPERMIHRDGFYFKVYPEEKLKIYYSKRGIPVGSQSATRDECILWELLQNAMDSIIVKES